MSESWTGENQTEEAAVRGGDFWDFMFGPRVHPEESSSSSSSSEYNPGDIHSNISPSMSQNESSESERNCINCKRSRWQNSKNGNTQMRSCWADGNMWELQIRRRRL